ncbi:MAG: ABC transporter permease [Ruthenibacterium lactatiformans]
MDAVKKKSVPRTQPLARRKMTTAVYFKQNWSLYLFLIPAVLLVFFFNYIPLYGIQIAFRDYTPAEGFFGSEWVGLKHFVRFFNSPKCWPVIWNTIKISVTTLLFTFPLPIVFAVFLNQVQNLKFKKFVQTITYVPYFISIVVLIGMVNLFLSPTSGIVNAVVTMFGGDPVAFMQEPQYFLPIYIITAIWQNTGWSAIIYIAALTSVPPELHEAAIVDGASKMRRIWSIDIPYIMPTIVIQLILAVGNAMNVGFEKVFLMQNPLNLEVSEVISTYVYKMGIMNYQYSFSTAINLFNSVINLILLLAVNKLCKKMSETSLF